jgi:WhiB family transcriptional regulator, redox-sensing transcriptional regulator
MNQEFNWGETPKPKPKPKPPKPKPAQKIKLIKCAQPTLFGPPIPSHWWYPKAACKGITDLMYPERVPGEPNYAAVDSANAKKVCFTECPARLLCLELALETDEDWGIWGGTSLDERRAIKRQRKGPRRYVNRDADAHQPAPKPKAD